MTQDFNFTSRSPNTAGYTGTWQVTSPSDPYWSSFMNNNNIGGFDQGGAGNGTNRTFSWTITFNNYGRQIFYANVDDSGAIYIDGNYEMAMGAFTQKSTVTTNNYYAPGTYTLSATSINSGGGPWGIAIEWIGFSPPLLPCPGPDPISLLDIQNAFGGTADTQIIEYYRGGAYVPDTAGNSNIPTSGQISFDQFFCSNNEVVVYITEDTENVVVSTLFGTDWTSSISKRLVVNSGVVVYNTNPYTISNLDGYAMRIYDTFNGTLTIENKGSIEGASGRAGGTSIVAGESRTNQDNGGQGGNAIYIGPTTYNGSVLSKTVNIDNQGTIYAGGGGGGKGGSSTSATSSSTTYSYASGSLTANVRGRSVEGGDGGRGQGYNKIWTVGSSASYVGTQATVTVNYRGGNSFKFPKDSVITINATGSGQVTHNFSSNSTINYNMNSSATTGGLTFAGSNNNITLNRYSSGFSGTITKDPNQSYTDNADSSSGFTGSVSNVSGGGSEQTSGQIRIIAAGVNATITVPDVSGYSGGTGGTWGNSGATGNNSGSPGGATGYAIANASQYVNYIDQGTITGYTT